MRSWILLSAVIAVLLASLYWCVGAVSGSGPAILEPPYYDVASMPVIIATIFAMWLALIATLAYSEYKQEFGTRGAPPKP